MALCCPICWPVDHCILLNKLHFLFLVWFQAYLSDRTQAISTDGLTSTVHFNNQSSMLGLLLFTIYINSTNMNNIHITPPTHTCTEMTANLFNLPLRQRKQKANSVEAAEVLLAALQRKLVLNADETKYVLFSRTHSSILHIFLPAIHVIVLTLKFFNLMTFKLLVEKLAQNLKIQMGVLY